MDAPARAVVLVEGISDQLALETLARRRGTDLDAEGVAVVPMGGATNVGHYLDRLRPRQPDLTLAGLCDAAEEGYFRRRGLERGLYVCVADLEDELIRALGVAAVEGVIEAQGDLGQFRTFQRQPAWRDRAVDDQLRRWLVASARRKLRYVRLLVEALDLTEVPRPLDGVLHYAVTRP